MRPDFGVVFESKNRGETHVNTLRVVSMRFVWLLLAAILVSGAFNKVSGQGCIAARSNQGIIDVPATLILDRDGAPTFRIEGEASRKDISSRLDWLLSERSSKQPKILIKNY